MNKIFTSLLAIIIIISPFALAKTSFIKSTKADVLTFSNILKTALNDGRSGIGARGGLSVGEVFDSELTLVSYAGIATVGESYGDFFSMIGSKYKNFWNKTVKTVHEFVMVTRQSFIDTGEVIRRISMSSVIESNIVSGPAGFARDFSDIFYDNVKGTVTDSADTIFPNIKSAIVELSRVPTTINPLNY